jgi:sec-independent protein translocase protein TatA
MGTLGFPEMLVLLVLALVVFGFGSKKLPDMGRGLGEGIRNFKRALKEGSEEPKETDKKE